MRDVEGHGDRSQPPLAAWQYQSGCRIETATARYHAVARVISFMRMHFADPISLQDMADIAVLSPYHFSRVFFSITQVSPRRFLAALRLDAAKRLLLETACSVTDVCFDVGYNSLGTFTTQFTQSIGLSPRHLRYLAQHEVLAQHTALRQRAAEQPGLPAPHAGVTGRISAASAAPHLIFVGLFPTSVPQSRPVACALLTAPGHYHITSVPDGQYYVFAAGSAWSADPLSYLLPQAAAIQVGGGPSPVHVRHGQASCPVDIALRAPQLTDPPILIALPFLLMQHLPDRPH